MTYLKFAKLLLVTALLGSICLQAEEPYDMVWVEQFGSEGWDYGDSIATDSKGNIYTTVDGSEGKYITKHSTDGVLLWKKSFSNSNYSIGYDNGDITVNKDDDVYIVGSDESSGHNGFIAKYDANGTLIFDKQFGTPSTDYITSVTTDKLGNIFITGYTYDVFNGEVSSGKSDAFVIKYDNNGAHIWTKQFGTAGYDRGYSVKTDNSGNLYIAGSTTGTLDGETKLGGWTDAYITKFSNDGVLKWNRQFGTPEHDLALSITIDKNDNLFIGGQTYGVFDGEVSNGYNDLFITRYNTDGVLEWNKQFGTSDWEYFESFTSDNNGNIFVTYANENYNYDWAHYITKVSNEGVLLWNKEIGIAGSKYGKSITSDTSNNILLTGYADDVFNQSDVFIMKLSSPNTPPIAIATTPENFVINGGIVELDGTQSYDADADNITYEWSWIKKPLYSLATFSDASSATPVFNADLVGSYVVNLRVNDGTVYSEDVNFSIEAVTVQTAVTRLLEQAKFEIQNMNNSNFKKKNQSKVLINKINTSIKTLSTPHYQNVVHKLSNDTIDKFDGCFNTNLADKNDWIVTCESQSTIYPLVTKAINYLQNNVK